MPSVPNSSLVIVESGWSGRSTKLSNLAHAFSSLAHALLPGGRRRYVARHKSNVDFRGGNLHDRRAEWSAYHTGRYRHGGRSLLRIFHVHAQVQVSRDHAAQKRGASPHSNVHRSGHVAGNFQLRRHAGELERHLEADLGEWLRGVGGPQQKRNAKGEKLQARIGENVLSQETQRLSPHR